MVGIGKAVLVEVGLGDGLSEKFPDRIASIGSDSSADISWARWLCVESR